MFLSQQLTCRAFCILPLCKALLCFETVFSRFTAKKRFHYRLLSFDALPWFDFHYLPFKARTLFHGLNVVFFICRNSSYKTEVTVTGVLLQLFILFQLDSHFRTYSILVLFSLFCLSCSVLCYSVFLALVSKYKLVSFCSGSLRYHYKRCRCKAWLGFIWSVLYFLWVCEIVVLCLMG